MGIGNQLKQVLDERNMNVNEFANILGVRAQRLYNIISRDTKKVQVKLLQQVAETLGVPIDYFYSEEPLGDFIKNNMKYDSDYDNRQKEDKDESERKSSIAYSMRIDHEMGKDIFVDIETVEASSNKRMFQMYSYYYQRLNNTGRKELLKRLGEMIRISEYTKNDDHQDEP